MNGDRQYWHNASSQYVEMLKSFRSRLTVTRLCAAVTRSLPTST